MILWEKSLSVVPDGESVAAVLDFLDACVEESEIPMQVGYKARIVADELYSNIVYYSQAQNAQVLFRVEEATVTLCFQDDGNPYNPLQAEDPDVTASAEDREIGGLGLFMVKKMAEDVRYEYVQGKNTVTVVLSKVSGKRTNRREDI